MDLGEFKGFFLFLAFMLMAGGTCYLLDLMNGRRNSWCCDHSPQHVAFTADEVAKATREHGCKNWSQNRVK